MKGVYESLFNKLKAILVNSLAYFLKTVFFFYLAMSINLPVLQFTLTFPCTINLSHQFVCQKTNSWQTTTLFLHAYSHTLLLSNYFWISHPQSHTFLLSIHRLLQRNSPWLLSWFNHFLRLQSTSFCWHL